MNAPRDKVILLGSEGIGGGDDILGYEILLAMAAVLSKRDDGPKAIICWNTAVRLLAEGSPLVPHFKRLEEKGVNILAGQLCVRELELMGKIAVGKMATMDEILNVMLEGNVISL
jgi:hypothetical protein